MSASRLRTPDLVQTGNKSALARIMIFGSSIAAGFAAASLAALQPNFSFRLSLKTFAGFAAGFLLLYVYWRILFHPSKTPAQRRLRLAASMLLALCGIAGFLYPLRYI